MTSANNSEKRVLVLRTSDKKGRGRGGFQWPTSGPVEAPDWRDDDLCGHGLHGLLWGCGDGGLLVSTADAVWQVVSVLEDDIRKLCGMVKFPRGEVVFSGDQNGATAYLDAHGAADKPVVFATRTASDGSAITAGDCNTITAGHGCTVTASSCGTVTAGSYSTITAGDCSTIDAGHDGTITASDYCRITTGYRSIITTGDYCRITVSHGCTITAGDHTRIKAGDRCTITAGDYSTVVAGIGCTVVAGDNSTVTAGHGCNVAVGPGGSFSIQWRDAGAGCTRTAVGVIGEGGIEADTAYHVVEGKLVKVDGQ